MACGNQASKNEDAEVAAGGLCTVRTRSLVFKAPQKGRSCDTVDVKTVFLQSLRREEKRELTLVILPAITKEVQVCGQEWWLVKGALYGFVESPYCESFEGSFRFVDPVVNLHRALSDEIVIADLSFFSAKCAQRQVLQEAHRLEMFDVLLDLRLGAGNF